MRRTLLEKYIDSILLNDDGEREATIELIVQYGVPIACELRGRFRYLSEAVLRDIWEAAVQAWEKIVTEEESKSKEV